MKYPEIDTCILYGRDLNGKLEAMVCLQVDDTIAFETEKFSKEEKLKSKSFNTTRQRKIVEKKDIKFNKQTFWMKDHFIKRNQVTHIENFQIEPIARNNKSFSSCRALAAYISTCNRSYSEPRKSTAYTNLRRDGMNS